MLIPASVHVPEKGLFVKVDSVLALWKGPGNCIAYSSISLIRIIPFLLYQGRTIIIISVLLNIHFFPLKTIFCSRGPNLIAEKTYHATSSH